MLYSNTLRESHVKDLTDIYVSIKLHNRLFRSLRTRLREHIFDLDLEEDFDGKKVNRLFTEQAMPQRADLRAMLYDFVTLDALGFLRSVQKEEKAAKGIIEKIEKLQKNFNAQVAGGQNPFLRLARDVDIADFNVEVPEAFLGKFIGYRRSSINGDIVRFYFRIFKQKGTKSPFVRYLNRYQRGNHTWQVQGNGVYNESGTLYLFGHARNSNTKKSLGYRIQAVQQIGGTDLLCGPLISMDSAGPIAARMLLVPLGEHMLTDFQKDQMAKSWQGFVDHIISQDFSHRKTDFHTEIRKNLVKIFGNECESKLYYYISNFTLTTLKGVPEPDNALINTEVLLRQIVETNGMDFSEHVSAILSALREKTMLRSG
ncbi:MAG: hypothetical protein V7723_05950 [Sneathiella sp.]|uniref:hypothetical protein n=1 Tax=Sneathiella sp. TaxID=1964365 RepID=UPI0030023F47